MKRAEKPGRDSDRLERIKDLRRCSERPRGQAETTKNFGDHSFLHDGGDAFQDSTTMRAMFDVDIEHSLEQTHPTDAHKSHGREQEGSTSSFLSEGIVFVFLAARYDLGKKLGIRRKYAMKMNEIELFRGM